MDILKIWLLLLAFLRPGIEGEGEGAGEGEGSGEGENTGEGTGEGEGEGSSEGEGEGEGAAAKNAAQEEAERRSTEQRERNERLERENVELRARLAPRVDAQEEEENRRLADEKTTALEKWQIQANRELRAGRSTAQAALLQAQDVNDRTAFASISMTDATAKKYETRVEKELADMRAKGQNAPREAIYTYLLGKDMREGKFKKKAAPAAGAQQTVNRGKLPGARSDVGAKGSLTEHEKREKRLENVQI